MEVAVTGTTFRTLTLPAFCFLRRTTIGRGRFTAPGLALAVALMFAGGCADMMQKPGEARNKGVKLYNAGKYTDAAGAFASATRKDPRDYQSYYYLGRSYESMKQFHQAIGSYRTALSVMKNHLKGSEDVEFRSNILGHLASAIATSGDPAAEAAQRVRAEGSGPNVVEEQIILAKVLQRQGDVDNAVNAFAQATLTDPNNFFAAREFGLYLLEVGQTERSTEQLKKAWVLRHKAKKPEDQQVAAGLRKLDVVPGPSLLEEEDLAQPPIPRGPIPEIDVTDVGSEPAPQE